MSENIFKGSFSNFIRIICCPSCKFKAARRVLVAEIKMAKRKNIRQKGKIRLSEYFKKIDNGEMVAIIAEKSVRASFPKRIQGSTGKVIGGCGNYKIVELNDDDKMKKFIIHPIHLRRV